MRKHVKKLTLSRETLLDLTHRQMGAAVGGASGDTTCECKDGSWCDCATPGCTLFSCVMC